LWRRKAHGPSRTKDELEGMMAAQLIAAHNAAMECYRRAMLGEQTFESRRENLSQANKLSRTYAAALCCRGEVNADDRLRAITGTKWSIVASLHNRRGTLF
jgi:hypothetical protein